MVEYYEQGAEVKITNIYAKTFFWAAFAIVAAILLLLLWRGFIMGSEIMGPVNSN